MRLSLSPVGEWALEKGMKFVFCADAGNCLLFKHEICAAQTNKALLRYRRDQLAVAGIHAAAAEAAGGGSARADLAVKQPLIGAERPMEPQGVIEARQLEIAVEQQLAVTDESGVEQGEVGCVGEHAIVQAGDRRGAGRSS